MFEGKSCICFFVANLTKSNRPRLALVNIHVHPDLTYKPLLYLTSVILQQRNGEFRRRFFHKTKEIISLTYDAGRLLHSNHIWTEWTNHLFFFRLSLVTYKLLNQRLFGFYKRHIYSEHRRRWICSNIINQDILTYISVVIFMT